jgi:hypothetical protein
MLGELLSELRTYASDRLRNPLLGPFTAAWVVANWRPLSVLFAGNDPIEMRISFIEENYSDARLLIVAPLIFAIIYSLLLPWINLGVQHVQEGVNLRRKKHKLTIDTDYLVASLSRAEAQATVNRILAKDELTRKQQGEIDQLKKELNESQGAAKASIAAKEAELEERKREFEARSHNDRSATEKERREIEKLQLRLVDERAKVDIESSRLRAELQEREKRLEERLEGKSGTFLSASNVEFESFLLSKKFRLFHNPSIGPERSKPIKFEAEGKITVGGNNLEHTWRISRGKLELIQADGKVHSRFFFLPDSQIFVHTGDKDTKSARGQYIIPDVVQNDSDQFTRESA